MSRRARRAVLIGAAAAAAAGAAVAVALWYDHEYYPTHHFSVVEPGVLLRSGQPDRHALAEAIQNYHIRTVVNLRGPKPDEPWYGVEANYCRRKGLMLVDIPMGVTGSDVDHLRECLAIVTDANCQPVLVHCEAGTARTSFAVAAYRIAVNKWDYDRAMAEAKEYGFRPEYPKHAEYVEVLRALAGGADWRGLRSEGNLPLPPGPDAASCSARPQ